MKKSTLILLFVFLVLAGGTAWYMSRQDNGQSTVIDTSDRDFAIDDVDDVSKIFVANRRRGTTHTLTKKGEDYWMLDDTYRANTGMVKLLLNTMKTIRIQSIPSEEATKNILKYLATDQVKVEIYDNAGERIRTYYVGGTNNENTGTYYLMENSTQPYIMEIPHFIGGLRIRHNINVQDWRDRSIFQIAPQDIAQVSIEYPKQKNKSFVLEKLGEEDYTIKPFYELTKAIDKPINISKVAHYFDNFAERYGEAFMNDYENRDKIETYVPFAKITVKAKDGTEQTVDLYPRENRDRRGNLRSETVDKYYGSINNNQDLMLIQHRVVEDVLWSYQTFF